MPHIRCKQKQHRKPLCTRFFDAVFDLYKPVWNPTSAGEGTWTFGRKLQACSYLCLCKKAKIQCFRHFLGIFENVTFCDIGHHGYFPPGKSKEMNFKDMRCTNNERKVTYISIPTGWSEAWQEECPGNSQKRQGETCAKQGAVQCISPSFFSVFLYFIMQIYRVAQK